MLCPFLSLEVWAEWKPLQGEERVTSLMATEHAVSAGREGLMWQTWEPAVQKA